MHRYYFDYVRRGSPSASVVRLVPACDGLVPHGLVPGDLEAARQVSGVAALAEPDHRVARTALQLALWDAEPDGSGGLVGAEHVVLEHQPGTVIVPLEEARGAGDRFLVVVGPRHRLQPHQRAADRPDVVVAVGHVLVASRAEGVVA